MVAKGCETSANCETLASVNEPQSCQSCLATVQKVYISPSAHEPHLYVRMLRTCCTLLTPPGACRWFVPPAVSGSLLLSVVPSCCKWFILLCLSLKLMSAMFKKLHLAYDKVVDVMATRKRYLATYFKVVFFGKVSAPSRLLHVCIHV